MSHAPSARSAWLFVTLLLAAVLPTGAQAQVSSRNQGLVVGGHLVWSSIGIEDADRSAGAGPGAIVGWGFGSGIGVFAQFDRSSIDVRNQPETPGSWGIWQFDAGVRYYLGGPEKSVLPFVQAAGTLRNVHVTDVGDVGGVTIEEIDLRGYAGSVGGGVQLHVSPPIAFEVSALLGWGSLTEGSVDGVDVEDFDISVQSVRVNIGLVWWPMG